MLTTTQGPPARQQVMVVYGTRPEAVKLAPVVLALARSEQFTPTVVVTGQHRVMLDQVNEVFGITPDVDLDIHQPGQTLAEITTRSLVGVQRALCEHRPAAVIVQGDTTTTFAAALAGFYEQVPVVHVEAGLRTNNPRSPFPEEINRRLTTQLSSLHCAPTPTSRSNLLAEGVAADRIVVTGNTVIDALLWTVDRRLDYGDPNLADLDDTGRPVLLVTAHRRESWGEPLRAVGRALAALARDRPDLLIVFPIHRNPVVRDAVLPALAGLTNVRVTEPLPYGGFCRLMNRADVLLTDSGGVQEEGPSLGKPVLVMRDTTERPEAVLAGTVTLVGTDEARIRREVGLLFDDRTAYTAMARAINPYGDGRAAPRVLGALADFLGVGAREPEFTVPATSDTAAHPRHTPGTVTTR